MGRKVGDYAGLLSLGGLFSGLGSVLVVVGLALSAPRWDLALHGTVAPAVVVAAERGSKGSRRPIAEFTSTTGKRVRVTGTVGGSVTIGERVVVYYDPADPTDAVIGSFTEMWFFLVLLGGMGVMWLGMGAPLVVIGVGRRGLRARLRAGGVSAPATLSQLTPVRRKGGMDFDLRFDAVDPLSGSRVMFEGDRRRAPLPVGTPGVVFVEREPPHRYFVQHP